MYLIWSLVVLSAIQDILLQLHLRECGLLWFRSWLWWSVSWDWRVGILPKRRRLYLFLCSVQRLFFSLFFIPFCLSGLSFLLSCLLLSWPFFAAVPALTRCYFSPTSISRFLAPCVCHVETNECFVGLIAISFRLLCPLELFFIPPSTSARYHILRNVL